MSAMPASDKNGSRLQAIWGWLRTRSSRPARDLMALTDDEVERIAEDLGVSVGELYRLARSNSKNADRLVHRMAAVDLDCNEVARLMPEALHDLQRVCTFCSWRKRCARDMARDPSDPRWKDYCPNATTLLALDAMPWAARRQW